MERSCSEAHAATDLRARKKAIFATLAVVFYCAVILSAFVHTLHPHLFISPDSDSDDDYSDVEERRADELEKELLRSGHPYAGDAIRLLARERQERAAARSVSRRRTGYTPHQSDDELPPPGPGRFKPAAGGARAQQQTYSSDDDEGSSASHSGSSDEERAVLVPSGRKSSGGAGGTSTSAGASVSTSRGRPPTRGHARQLSDISSSGVESESASENEAPARSQAKAVEQREMGRRRSSASRSRSRSRSRRCRWDRAE